MGKSTILHLAEVAIIHDCIDRLYNAVTAACVIDAENRDKYNDLARRINALTIDSDKYERG